MSSCNTNPVPGSYVLPDTAIQRIGNYVLRKQGILNSLLGNGRQETTSIPLYKDQFLDLCRKFNPPATGVRIYFASYRSTISGSAEFIPAEMEDLLTLIFAPTIHSAGQDNDTGDYYIVNSLDLTQAQLIPEPIANDWVSYYQNTKLGLLENYEHTYGHDANFSETKSMKYLIKHITEWVDELVCWGRTFPNINLSISIAAYTQADTPSSRKNKLTLVLSMTDSGNILDPAIIPANKQLKINLPVLPENFEYFSLRKQLVKELIERGGDYDTGNPCPPPNGNCPGANLPHA